MCGEFVSQKIKNINSLVFLSNLIRLFFFTEKKKTLFLKKWKNEEHSTTDRWSAKDNISTANSAILFAMSGKYISDFHQKPSLLHVLRKLFL